MPDILGTKLICRINRFLLYQLPEIDETLNAFKCTLTEPNSFQCLIVEYGLIKLTQNIFVFREIKYYTNTVYTYHLSIIFKTSGSKNDTISMSA